LPISHPFNRCYRGFGKCSAFGRLARNRVGIV